MRQARFGAQNAQSSEEALKAMTEVKQKREERAARFGIETKDARDEKIKKRIEKFGIETKEAIEAKKQSRMERFADQYNGGNKKNGDGGIRQVL